MSFISISDPRKRNEIVQEYLATKKRIQQGNYNQRMVDLNQEDEMQKLFRPMVTSTEKSTASIKKELDPIRVELQDLNSKVLHKKTDTIVKDEDDSGASKDIDLQRESTPTLHAIMKKYNIPHRDQDRYFGIRKEKDSYVMGTKKVTFDDAADINVDGKKYTGTKGLWNLIMLEKPVDYEGNDFIAYMQLVKQTNVKQHPHKSKGKTRPYGTSKWRKILSTISDDEGDVKGEGVIYLPSTIKALEDKLKVLLAEYNAGNQTSTRNEIIPIADALLKRKAITQGEYKDINTFLSSRLQ